MIHLLVIIEYSVIHRLIINSECDQMSDDSLGQCNLCDPTTN